MTVKEFKEIIDEMEVENSVEVRIVDQYDEEKDTYYLKLPVIHMVSI